MCARAPTFSTSGTRRTRNTRADSLARLAGEKEQEIGPRDGREDLGDLLLVRLEPGIRHAKEEVAVLAGDDAVPEQRENDFLGDLQPVGADLPALVVQEDLRARPEKGGNRLLELLTRLDERVPLEVRQRAFRTVRCPFRRGAQGARELFGAVLRGVRVLCPGQAQRLEARMLEEAAPRRGEGRNVEGVERGVPGFRAHAEPDGLLDRSLSLMRQRRARARMTPTLDSGTHAVHEDRELAHVLRALSLIH